jgi:hypothetical protein
LPSTQLFPEVIDASTLGARVTAPIFLPIGIEGQAGVGGTATVGALYTVERPSESEGLFGVDSNLDKLVKFVLGRGVSPVIAGASIKGTYSAELVERQVVWANMESDEHIRIRLTDTEVQANIAALADSCENAELIYNKQFCAVGLASGTTKANLLAGATAVSSKRGMLVGPGVYDNAGVLLGGKFAAAAVAAEVAMNPDIADDLDTAPLVNLTGIEKDAVGLPVFRRKVVAGVAQNDFEDLLQGGVSVLKQGVDGGVEITHLRTTYTTDGTFDSLMTRLIVDQIFLIVKGYCKQFLRRGNDETTRQALKSGVEALLNERRNWIRPKTLPDGTEGYVVTVTSSSDGRQLTVAYEGSVVRGVSTIQVAAKLDIAV